MADCFQKETTIIPPPCAIHLVLQLCASCHPQADSLPRGIQAGFVTWFGKQKVDEAACSTSAVFLEAQSFLQIFPRHLDSPAHSKLIGLTISHGAFKCLSQDGQPAEA